MTASDAPESMLRAHTVLDALTLEMTHAAREGRLDRVRDAWPRLAAMMLAHFAAEESGPVPLYAAEHPDDAHGLLDDHERMRGLLQTTAAHLESGDASPNEVLRVIASFRMHHAREEVSLYRWMREGQAA